MKARIPHGIYLIYCFGEDIVIGKFDLFDLFMELFIYHAYHVISIDLYIKFNE
jgi:hypothetical protein